MPFLVEDTAASIETPDPLDGGRGLANLLFFYMNVLWFLCHLFMLDSSANKISCPHLINKINLMQNS